MSLVASIRPDDWNFPLLVHVVGAALLVGGLVTAVIALLLGWNRESAWYSRLGFRALVFIALPAWFVMRIGAQWIYSREGFSGDLTADLGGILLLLSIILTGLGVRQLGRGGRETSVLVRIGSVIAVLVLLAYVVAVWAMSGKPD